MANEPKIVFFLIMFSKEKQGLLYFVVLCVPACVAV